jgi:hypothetical protein
VAQRGQDVEADADVLLDVRVLLGREASRLVQHALADPDHAHVVQATGEAHRLGRVLVEAQLHRDRRRQIRRALRRAAQERILRLHRRHQRFGHLDAHAVQRRAVALQLRRRRRHLVADRALHRVLLEQQPATVQRLLDRAVQHRQLDRLEQVVDRAGRERRARGGRVVHGAQHQDRQVRIDRVRLRHHVDAADARHAHVAQHEREAARRHRRQRGRARGHRLDLVAARAQEAAEREADGLLVVHHEDADRAADVVGCARAQGGGGAEIGHHKRSELGKAGVGGSGGSDGSATANVVPAPGVLRTVISPPCDCTMP